MSKFFMFVAAMIIASNIVLSQDSSRVSHEACEELKGAHEGLNETVIEMKNALDALRKIKVSGYLQAQFQTTDGAGVGSFAGGNFPAGVSSRFAVRRGRVKFNYDNDLTQYVLQIDVTQGGVGIKDAYVSVKEPWSRTVALTAGIFDRPFGFEISYSSSSRESPERSRLFQTLFPGEREIGMKLEMASEMGLFSFVNVKAGLFNGVLNTANENDNTKDFIGRAGFQLPLEDMNLAIDGGVSLYSGKVQSNSKFVNSFSTATKTHSIDSTAANNGSTYERSYLGVDVEVYYDLPLLGGLSLRGEFIQGKQPGTSTSNSFYNPGATSTALYQRNFSGYYVNYIQNIGLSHQFLLKYDVLDPNSDADATDIGAPGTNLNVADVRYSNVGIGWIYYWDPNVKFVFYYDMVTNESINSAASGSLATFTGDLKDNVFTFRIQYKF